MPPFTIQQQVTFLYTRDLAAGSAFLRDKIGLRLALNQFDLCHIYEVAPNAFLGVCTNRPAPADPGVTYSFVVSDTDAAYETLRGRGVEFEAPPQLSERFNVYSAFFGGIENYRFEIQEFRDPSWPVPVS
ncbi:MAG: VOC family protein [Alphaproteobacteria bacterium]|nr:VOC family protein [Alphaproteobacteria bacterium]